MSAAARLSRSLWIGLAIPVAAYAHVDKVTGQNYEGFERNDGRGSCCDWHDCRPALAPFMEEDGEKIVDRNNNKFAFDPGKVVKRPSDDGNWHVCGNATRLNCIIAPVETRRETKPDGNLFGWIGRQRPESQSRIPTAAELARELEDAPICRAPGM